MCLHWCGMGDRNIIMTRIIFFLLISMTAQAQPYTIVRSGDTLFLKNYANGSKMKLNYRDFKTINNQSIMGVGNVTVTGDTSSALQNRIDTVVATQLEITNKAAQLEAKLGLIADTTISTTWDGGGRVYRYNGYKIKGSGTLKNWIIQAPLTADCFDTSINLINCTSYDNIFSCAWYGAKTSNPDNWWNIQKSINYCNGNIPNLFLPSGNYHYSQPLEIYSIYQNQYVSATLHFYGESVMNGSTNGSTLIFEDVANSALNLQQNKGSEIDHLNIIGKWKSPQASDSIYYNTTFANYNDVSGNNIWEWYYGISTDVHNQIGNTNPNGSTKIYIHDCTISGFTKLIAISQSNQKNGEMITIENCSLGEARVGIATGQAQEKGNWIKNIKAWGRIHTVFQIGRSGTQQSAGDWHIEGGNVDGPIRVFDINASGWYSTHVNGLYAENIGMIGDLYAAVPISINNSTFHLKLWTNIGKRIIINSSGTIVAFHDCMVRYYGLGGELWIHGMPKIDGGLWQDSLINK